MLEINQVPEAVFALTRYHSCDPEQMLNGGPGIPSLAWLQVCLSPTDGPGPWVFPSEPPLNLLTEDSGDWTSP